MKIERFTIEGKKSNKPYIRRTKKNHKLPFYLYRKTISTLPLKEKPFFG